MTGKIKRVGVFCSARDSVGKDVLAFSNKFGKALARNGYTLVYGGGDSGVMGAVAKGAESVGGEILGIVPKCLLSEQGKGDYSHVCVETMAERKMMISKLSDAYVVLPGGFGTLDELFEVVTLRQIGVENKPIYVLDPGLNDFSQFSTTLIELMERMLDLGTINHKELDNIILFEYSIADVIEGLKSGKNGDFVSPLL